MEKEMTLQLDALPPEEAGLARWIEAETGGGRLVAFARQPRWRPMYLADVQTSNGTLKLLARHERADMPLTFPLKHEMMLQRTLHEHGIPVPRVYAWKDDPACFLMERVNGVPHLQGLEPAARDNVMHEYMRTLAKIHALPVDTFRQAGVMAADRPENSHLLAQQQFERIYRSTKKRPDAFIEFALDWLRRHPIKPHSREAVVTYDSGQFHQQDGKLVALVDLEIGHIGDPMSDLGGMRMRDTILGFGNLDALYKVYEDAGGYPIDRQAVHFHNLFFSLTNAMCVNGPLTEPPPETDYMVNLQWMNSTNRYGLEAIADSMGIALPQIALAAAETTPATTPFRHLTAILGRIQSDDVMLQHELRGAFRLSRHLARWDEIGRQVMQSNLDDMAELIGRRPADWQDGETALEAFVLASGGKHDEELVLLFNRRLQRALAMNGPEGSAMTRHNPIQPLHLSSGDLAHRR